MAEKLEKSSEELPQSAQPEKIHKTADPRLHSEKLDALRGIGCLGVVLLHTVAQWYSTHRNPLIIPLLDIDLLDLFLSSLGSFGLALFFLLSGYLLSWTEGRRASKGDYTLRSYAFRRALRLLPAYYVALVVVFLLWPTDPTLADALSHLAVLQTFWPDYVYTGFDRAFWSLTPEVVFYALLPLLVLKIRGLYARLALFGALAVVSATIQAYMYINLSAWGDLFVYYLYVFPLTHLWLFMAGVLLRMLVERLEEKRPGGSWPTLAFSLFAGSLVLLVLVPYVPFVKNATIDAHFRMLTDLLAIPFFAAALLGSPVLSRILSWRLLGFVGMISYSLFLLHGTVLLLAKDYLLRSPLVKPLHKNLDGAEAWLAFAGYLGFILLVAGALSYLSYRYVESPFLRIKPK